MAASAARSRRGWRCTRRPGAAEPDVVVAWNAKDAGHRDQARPIQRRRPHVRTAGVAAVGRRGRRSRLARAGARRPGHGARAVARSPRPGRPGDSRRAEHQHKGEHDGVAMAQMSSLRYATFGARASADREITPGVCYCCKTAVVALPGGRRGVGVAPRLCRQPARHRLHRVARRRRHLRETGPGQRGRLGDQRLPRRRAGAGRRPGWRRPHRVADRDSRRRAARRALLRADAGVGRASPPASASRRWAARSRRIRRWRWTAPAGCSSPGTRSIDGVRTAAFSVAERAGGVVRFGAPTRLASDGPTLYPVMAPLAQGVVVAWTARARRRHRRFACSVSSPRPRRPRHRRRRVRPAPRTT